MRLNDDKRRKLADLLAKQRAAVIESCLLIPLAPSTSTVPAPQPINPTPIASELKGVLR